MYGSERFMLPLPRPFPMYYPRPSAASANKSGFARNELDEFTSYRPEIPQNSSTENSGENRNDLLASSENREFSSCFTSYMPPIPSPSMPPCMPQRIAGSEARWFDAENCATRMECEVTREEERKTEREHKKRSKNWTRLETLKLIRVRSEIDVKFGRTGRKAELWDEISEALQRDNFARDAQQCKDKWEKLSAGYKEVKDGVREKEDFPYYDELHLLLSGRFKRKDRDHEFVASKDKQEVGPMEVLELDLSGELDDTPSFFMDATGEGQAEQEEEQMQTKRQKKFVKYVSVTDLSAVQEMMESLLAKQQKFFNDLLDAVEKKEQLKEQLRQEREDRWRAEEREQRRVFNNAMLILTQKLLGENPGTGFTSIATSSENVQDELGGPKKRSKNWKKSEVLQLIKSRTDFDSKFAVATQRTALWEEIAEILGSQGIQRDAKQCREKWDKLMAEIKDVLDGRRDQSESPFFPELKAFIDEGH